MTLFERAVLHNQYRILAALSEEKAERERYDAVAEAVECGYEAHYFEELLDRETFDAESAKEVREILSMYDDLIHSAEAIPPAERPDVVFKGFDGNEETKHMAYARYFCERFDGGGRYASLRASKGFDFNSHWPSLSRYRPMLQAYRSIRDAKRSGGSYKPLSAEEIRRVLASTD